MNPYLAVVTLAFFAAVSRAEAEAWPRHTIDDTSRGADGVRLADVDGDGRQDIVTGWEEGGLIRVYRQPAGADLKEPWPSVTVGGVRSPEDAVFVDLNRDGNLDVVSCCEGKTRAVFAHYAPSDPQQYWEDQAWSTESLTHDADQQAWMFCLPLRGPSDSICLIVGSKGERASISRLREQADQAADVQRQRLRDAGWIMSLRGVDMDGDADADILFSDRKGPTRGIGWLEQPHDANDANWPCHMIGGQDAEVMFLDVGDLDGDGSDEIVAATKSDGILICRRDASSTGWTQQMIALPDGSGSGKGVAIGDIDRDGWADLVVSCEHAERRHGVYWMSATEGANSTTWKLHPVSGNLDGTKFDRLELLDLDADGDLDVLTCEERENLGVIWFENPRSR